MARTLEFLVYGLARSGTSAMASYLSAVPGVHCGMEVFPTFLDHATIRAPRDFLAHDDPAWKAASVDEITARGDEIRVWGNKTPTYFYNLAGLYQQLGPVPSLLSLRPLEKVAASYAMRAGDPGDGWPAGRGALFACGDALVLIQALAQLERTDHILAVPQSALSADWRAVMTAALAHVAPGVAPVFREADLARIDRRRKTSAARAKPPREDMAPVERAALNKMAQIGVGAVFASAGMGPVSDRHAALRALVETGPAADPVGWMTRAVARHPDPAAAAFLPLWTRHVARVTRSLRQARAAARAHSGVQSGT